MITNRFSTSRPVSCVQGRHGEMIIVQGDGVRPARSDSAGPAVDAGMDPPATAPAITAVSPARYYVARADVYKSGACYYAPPAVTFTSDKGLDKARGRAAKAKSFLGQSAVAEVRVDDGGKYYLDSPSVELSATYGTGASLEVELDGTPTGGGGGDPFSGLTQWIVVQAPYYLDDVGNDDGLTWYYAKNGTVKIGAVSGASPALGNNVRLAQPAGGRWDGSVNCNAAGVSGFSYSVSGGSGSGASLSLTFSGAQFACSSTTALGVTTVVLRGARSLVSVKAEDFGSGYKDGETVVLTIKSASGDPDRDIILHGVTSGSTQNTTADRFSVRSISIKSGGSGYLVAPQLKIVSNSGFGAYATCTVKNGKIDTVTLENGGGGYKTPPTVEVVSGGAEVFAVSRPHLRGTYQCYYRYIDDTPEKSGGPIPSNLSPVLEVDAGEGSQALSWAVPQPTGRARKLELWRTTSNQATTLYRVATLEATTGGDTPSGSAIAVLIQPEWSWSPLGTTSIRRWYAYSSVSASGPGTLSFQWQGQNTTSNSGATWSATGWQNISSGDVYFIQTDDGGSQIGTVASLSTFPNNETHYQKYRCYITSSVAGVAPVYSSVSGPSNWQLTSTPTL